MSRIVNFRVPSTLRQAVEAKSRGLRLSLTEFIFASIEASMEVLDGGGTMADYRDPPKPSGRPVIQSSSLRTTERDGEISRLVAAFGSRITQSEALRAACRLGIKAQARKLGIAA